MNVTSLLRWIFRFRWYCFGAISLQPLSPLIKFALLVSFCLFSITVVCDSGLYALYVVEMYEWIFVFCLLLFATVSLLYGMMVNAFTLYPFAFFFFGYSDIFSRERLQIFQFRRAHVVFQLTLVSPNFPDYPAKFRQTTAVCNALPSVLDRISTIWSICFINLLISTNLRCDSAIFPYWVRQIFHNRCFNDLGCNFSKFFNFDKLAMRFCNIPRIVRQIFHNRWKCSILWNNDTLCFLFQLFLFYFTSFVTSYTLFKVYFIILK